MPIIVSTYWQVRCKDPKVLLRRSTRFPSGSEIVNFGARLTRLGLVMSLQQQGDGSYLIQANEEVVEQLDRLGSLGGYPTRYSLPCWLYRRGSSLLPVGRGLGAVEGSPRSLRRDIPFGGRAARLHVLPKPTLSNELIDSPKGDGFHHCVPTRFPKISADDAPVNGRPKDE